MPLPSTPTEACYFQFFGELPLVGVQAWPPINTEGQRCPVCISGIKEGHDRHVCLWCLERGRSGVSPAMELRLRGPRERADYKRSQDEAKDQENQHQQAVVSQVKVKAKIGMSPQEVEAYWWGGSERNWRADKKGARAAARAARPWLIKILTAKELAKIGLVAGNGE